VRSFKWGILGPGKIAHKFAKGLAVLNQGERQAVPYAIGSRDLERAKEFAGEYGYQKAYGSYQELVQDPDVELIYVATPHPQHLEAAILCLEHGKAVVCEKPLTVNAKEAAKLIACARKNGVFLMEAMWTRFLPALVKAKELIDSGAIGEVLHIDANFGFRAGLNPESRLFAPAYAGGSLLDVGVYPISLARWIYGAQPERAQSHMRIGSTGVDETMAALLSYSNGRSASVQSAIRLNTDQTAVIYGEEGFMRLPSFWAGKKILLHKGGAVQELDFPYEATGYQFEALEAMACLERGLTESPVMPLDESLEIIETMDKIRADCGLKYPME
jgi:predicted dehydrogenase